MKANELMLGDWVIATNNGAVPLPSDVSEMLPRVGKVVGIDCDCVVLDFEDFGFMLDCIEPIPLTAEILEKNGFARFGTDYILKERHFGLENPSIPSNYLDNYWLRVSIKAVHIEYIHELQHALRLCGIEKEIML